jgi:hypothetical protein
MSSLYYSGDTGTNRGTSLRHPWDARRCAQIRSDVLCQAAEDLAAEEQAQVEHYDLLYHNNKLEKCNGQPLRLSTCDYSTNTVNLLWGIALLSSTS